MVARMARSHRGWGIVVGMAGSHRGQETERAGKRVVGPDPAGHFVGGQGPVDASIVLRDFWRIGGQRFVLLRGGEFAGKNPPQVCDERFTAKCGETVMQLTGRFVGADRHLRDVKHRTAIETRGHRHQADPCRCITGQNGSLDRRGATPARQSRRVHVHTAVRRNVEHILRQDQAVGRDDKEVGLQCDEVRNGLFVTQGRGLLHGNTLFERIAFDRAGSELLATTRRSIGLSHYGNRDVSGIDQRPQRRQRKIRRTGKNEPGHIAIAA